jgi:serine/threonine-protein phosphatase 2A regulatory subunit B'
MWVVQHTGSASSVGPVKKGASSTSSATATSSTESKSSLLPVKVPSPFPRLPALKSSPAWQRKGLLLQKLRQCSIAFDGVDPIRFQEDWEIKRNTLLEVVDYCDQQGRQLFNDPRVLEDTFTMIKLNIFRALPRAPEPSGDPDEEEQAFADIQWPHLNIAYELLLRLVSMDHIDLTMKKKVVDPSLVRQLTLLFDSEDARERDYLKTITHRIYSKLTQRRALIRRVICYVFFEFVFETEQHNGIAEMLEILASIINGFAVPIKDEHRMMLIKALLPLHKTKAITAFHPQLSYCMALYVAKDHCLTRDIIPGLLKFWPFGSSSKQILFLNELEDIFEYVIEEDVTFFREQLALRLAKCIGGLHFQVCERTLVLWNSERVSALLLYSALHRPHVLKVLFPVLHENHLGHWHESIRTLSGQILDSYASEDPELFASLRDNYEKRSEEKETGLADLSSVTFEETNSATGGKQSPNVNSSSSATITSFQPNSSSSSSSPSSLGGGGGGGGLNRLSSGNASTSMLSPANRRAVIGLGGGNASLGGSSEESLLSPTGSEGSGRSPVGALSGGHRAPPAVRASSSFAVSDNADLLPAAVNTPNKRSELRHSLGSLSMPLPSTDGGED